ncbi:FAD-dependent oxidoreductase [Desulfolucanica intricata]|uniref:FAD-dependent oxidoreductase n=1 Tax=Desulfolucanica intricata TaxID=1285191 RepID=UPI0008321E24|nr:FAD-dependent oxidoreductase [Desulfolucanica intricata]
MIVITGGGWGGCAAAFSAARAGAKVILLEKTDMLLGTGLVGGIMRNNGRFTATEEACVMGAGDFFGLIDKVSRHRNINFPGHKHATLYDVTMIEPVIREALQQLNVEIRFFTRVTGVNKKGQEIKSLVTAKGEEIVGDAFIDTTGSAGPVQNCTKYGSGCAMCILRCPSFGPRVSVTAKAGIKEIRAGEGFPHFEAMSGSCKLDKKSLAPELVNKLERDGVLVCPLPAEFHKGDILNRKACQQYALADYASNLIILDTGHAKIMTPFFPLETLRQLRGFENARYADPYSGGKGNSIRFMALAPCDDSLRVTGCENLFCAGEKTGLLVGHTEAIVTGFLAGHNAVRYLSGKALTVLPTETVIGDLINFMHKEMKSPSGLEKKYTFSGSVYYQRMQDLNLYSTDLAEIKKRVQLAGVEQLFNQKYKL